ncbi:MAG: histidinol phosphatase [Crocinitomicaceae bacterium]|jgi:tyrosine-protein phosphatase YwqE|nr:histidinol phosphatase [Crocinitomicaceae bacterium]
MGLLGGLFGKKKQEPFNFGSLHTDMHSHLIPGIDDGSKDMDDTLRMIEKFMEMGYKRIITTPHIKTGSFDNTSEIIKKGEEDVKNELAKRNIDLDFQAAAEYFFDYTFLEKVEKGDLLTFGQNHILVEYAFGQPPMGAEDMFFQLQMKGYNPILAHFERYVYYHGSVAKAEELRNRNIKIQMNIGSVIGHYGPLVQKQAEKMLKAGVVDYLASDCHRMEHLTLFEAKNQDPLFALVGQQKWLNNRL